MEKGDVIFEFLRKLNTDGEMMFGRICDIKEFSDTDGELIDLIKKHDVIKSKLGEFTYDTNVYITANGRKALGFKNWNKFVEESNMEKQNSNQEVHIYGNNNGNINQSSNTDFKKPITQKTVHKTDKEANKKSWIEKLSWIIGIIAGLFAIYEFIIKKLIEDI